MRGPPKVGYNGGKDRARQGRRAQGAEAPAKERNHDRLPPACEDRELSASEALEVLEAGEFCVVSTVDVDGMPYGVPLSYVMLEARCASTPRTRPGTSWTTSLATAARA